MKVSFGDDYLLVLYQGTPPGKPKYQEVVVKQFRKTVRFLQTASDTKQLREFRSLNFEALSGKWEGYYSVRVNRKYRLIITVLDEEVQISEVGEEELIIEELNNHYQ